MLMTEETNTPETNQEVQLSIADIMLLKQIVEVGTARGAFRANELTQIGGVYDKVNAWLAEVAPPEQIDDTEESEKTEGEANA